MFELIFACQIWGFGFIATVWALDSFSPVAMTALRFLIAVLIGAPILLIPKVRKAHLNKEMLLMALWPGVLISLVLIFQTWGLLYTTATKSGFLTTLYAVLVPIAEWLIFKRRLHKSYIIWILIALLGTALIVQLKWGPINKGDFLTILCAFAAAGHIIAVGRIARRATNTFWLNYYQCLWAGLFSLLVVPFFPAPHIKPLSALPAFGFMWLVLMSTMLAFALQVRAQKVLNATHAGLIYLLESPFAFLFAIIFLNETLTAAQLLGAILILASALGATWSEHRALKHL